jgi:hypothetical protein
MASVTQRILEEYPAWGFLLKDPEVGKLLRDAVSPTGGFSPSTFQAKLYQTKWFRRRSQTMREYEIRKATDPGEHRRLMNIGNIQVRDMARRLGVKLNGREVSYMSASALQRGMDINSDEFRYTLANYIRSNPKRIVSGAIQATMKRIDGTSRGQYYVGASKQDQRRWGIAMALGQRTDMELEEWMKGRAASRYPHLAARLKAGETMEDMFSGHKQVIAEELELDPNAIDLSQGRWAKVLDTYDKNEGKHRPYTLSEVTRLARQDQRFWKTSKGQEMQSSLANFLMQTFGERA